MRERAALIVYSRCAHVASMSVVKKIYDGDILPPHELLTRWLCVTVTDTVTVLPNAVTGGNPLLQAYLCASGKILSVSEIDSNISFRNNNTSIGIIRALYKN